MQGFLNVYKPSGMSSGTVVAKIKKRFHIDKIGHMGTLDPMASGILPIAIGKATRMFDYFLDKTKRYIAVFDFNYSTDTLDATGKVIKTCEKVLSKNDIDGVLNMFVGQIAQVPPMYSAKNVAGTRAYTLARLGQNVLLAPKNVIIEKIICTKTLDKNIFEFDITCGSGTYIRSLARDIAAALDTCACMTKLERIESGKFVLENSTTLDDLLKTENLSSRLIKIDDVFDAYGKIALDDKNNKLLNGLSVKINLADGNYFLCDSGEVVAVVGVSGGVGKMKTYLRSDK